MRYLFFTIILCFLSFAIHSQNYETIYESSDNKNSSFFFNIMEGYQFDPSAFKIILSDPIKIPYINSINTNETLTITIMDSKNLAWREFDFFLPDGILDKEHQIKIKLNEHEILDFNYYNNRMLSDLPSLATPAKIPPYLGKVYIGANTKKYLLSLFYSNYPDLNAVISYKNKNTRVMDILTALPDQDIFTIPRLAQYKNITLSKTSIINDNTNDNIKEIFTIVEKTYPTEIEIEGDDCTEEIFNLFSYFQNLYPDNYTFSCLYKKWRFTCKGKWHKELIEQIILLNQDLINNKNSIDDAVLILRSFKIPCRIIKALFPGGSLGQEKQGLQYIINGKWYTYFFKENTIIDGPTPPPDNKNIIQMFWPLIEDFPPMN